VQESTFVSKSAGGVEVFGYCWSPAATPRGIVQIAHGMGEHAARYRRVAAALTDAGYVVYANDHRGHGRTAGTPDRFGDLGPGGWQALVDDIGALGRTARREHPDRRLALFGHSMGSFAVQQYLLDHSADVDAVVLSGTSAVDVVSAGIDPNADMDFSALNAPFQPARTDFDWLSRDPDEVDKYVADPACGFGICTADAAGMLSGIAPAADPERLGAIRPDLPILVFSGDADPLAGGGDLVQLVGQRYRDAGVRDVTVTLYPGARHEILNETNRDQVTADLLAFLDRTIGT
jgi:alpha-beta hydrolase superfamily lysophospholipase